MTQILDLCNHIVRNDPQIETLEIPLYAPTVETKNCTMVRMHCHPGSELYWYWACNFDVKSWRKIGRALGRNQTLRMLEITCHPGYPETTLSLQALFDGLKRNSSLETLKLFYYFIGHQNPIFDFDHFLRNNGSIKHLELRVCAGFRPSYSAFPSDQWLMLARGLENSALESLELSYDSDVYEANGLTNGSFGRVILACSRVKELRVVCRSGATYAALADLLRDRRAMLRTVTIFAQSDADHKEGLSMIAESLVGNTTLKELSLGSGGYGSSSITNGEPFGPILCDPSSFESIRNSNHTLERISRPLKTGILLFRLPRRQFSGQRQSERLDCLQHIEDCLELNKNKSKEEVIRNKIQRYYFVGNFNIDPIVDMPISLLPRLISFISGNVCNRYNAIFRLLRNISDLCNRPNRDIGRLGESQPPTLTKSDMI